MNVTLLARSGASDEQLVFDEKVQAEARAVVAEAHDRKPVSLSLQLEDGEAIPLPKELSDALIFALKGMTQGNVSMRALPEELTTSTAAGILGVSRPTLMKLIESKELPSTKVGSHHRLNAHDVLALREQRDDARRKAFEELRQIDMDLDLD
ncbi:helix-turn-helix domain-containing protein [Agromyces salentinus]|uniref:Helix-turn-helix domain-containing protein n=1 Tax=Agromyces salentinus TaxID=269421 RepID=A0ABP4Z214_9MICO|nr:helix-turn-helix domain-containing protein [Agromyces salentinus]